MDTDLGAWTGDDLIRTAHEFFGDGADADLPAEVRLLSAVAKLVRRRRAVDQSGDDPPLPSVFLLRPRPPESAPATLVPMIDNGMEPLAGRVWFAPEALRSGRYIEVGEVSDAELFSFACDQLGCGDVPAVVVDPRTSPNTFRFYPSGLARPEVCEVIEDRTEEITLDDIVSIIDLVYENSLKTPAAQDEPARLWNAPRRPAEKAEGIVQMYVRNGLSVGLPTCRIRKEQTGVPGRLDLLIEHSEPLRRGRVTVVAVLELKVLRSRGSTGLPVSPRETAQWIDSGVRQAATYRDDRDAENAALCAFDMRDEDTGLSCFDDVLLLAEELEVKLKRWYVYSTPGDFRAADIAAP